MLSDRTLERVSVSYRRGYRDGYAGKAQAAYGDFDSNSLVVRPFANHDYQEGYRAGANDRKWNNELAQRVTF